MEAVEGHLGNSCLIPSLTIDENSYLKIVHIADRLANTEEVFI
jgi:hypothetical protein